MPFFKIFLLKNKDIFWQKSLKVPFGNSPIKIPSKHTMPSPNLQLRRSTEGTQCGIGKERKTLRFIHKTKIACHSKTSFLKVQFKRNFLPQHKSPPVLKPKWDGPLIAMIIYLFNGLSTFHLGSFGDKYAGPN